MNEPKTPNLGLNKIDRSSLSTTYFDLDKYLDQNWEKVDEGVATKEDLEELRDAVGEINVPDASLTQKGKVQLSNAVDSEMEDMAATPKAVKSAMNEALLAKQLGVEQKANVVAVLNSIGVLASTIDSWDTLITKLTGVIRATGNASAADVREGKQFSNSERSDILGTLPERSTGSVTITPWNNTQTKQAGIYGGDIIVPGVVVPANKVAVGTTIAGTAGTLVEVPKATIVALNINAGRSALGRDYPVFTPLVTIPSAKKYIAFNYANGHYMQLAGVGGAIGYIRFAIRNSSGQVVSISDQVSSGNEMLKLILCIIDLDNNQLTYAYDRESNINRYTYESTSLVPSFLANSTSFELGYQVSQFAQVDTYNVNCFFRGNLKYA